MRRGDIVVVALQGNAGKPCPALVISADLSTTAPPAKMGRVIGRADDATMLSINRALAVFLGLA